MAKKQKTTFIIKKYGTCIRFCTGMIALFIGSLEYFLSRPSDSSYVGMWFRKFFGEQPLRADIFGFLSGVIPDFVHPFSFSLLTMTLYPLADKKNIKVICFFWLIVDVIFEFGQLIDHKSTETLYGIFSKNIVSKIMLNYFASGTYDHFDIVAIFLGCIAAYYVGYLTSPNLTNGN